MGVIKKLKKVFSNDDTKYLKSINDFGSSISNLKSYYKKLDDDFLEELMIVLLQADVGVLTAEKICKRLKTKCDLYPSLTFNEVFEFLIEVIQDMYNENDCNHNITYNESGPTVVLMVGVNGSGKTTSCAKLINYFKSLNKSCILVAADTFRAGATQQLVNWSQKLDVQCITGKDNQDPSSVIVDGCRIAKENNIDIVICDTAGRLQNKVNLMNELDKIYRVINKEIKGGPHNTYLVLDANTGQNGISQASNFDVSSKIDGIILTKFDGTSKGGIVLAIKDLLSIPVKFIGTGESVEDLKEFELELFLYSLVKDIKDE